MDCANGYLYAHTGISKISYTIKIPKKSILTEKKGNRDIFGQKLKMGFVFTHLSINYSNTNSLRLFCDNSILNSANFTERVIFCGHSWKFYPSSKIFYTSVTCATCDKFHVCLFILSYMSNVDFITYTLIGKEKIWD